MVAENTDIDLQKKTTVKGPKQNAKPNPKNQKPNKAQKSPKKPKPQEQVSGDGEEMLRWFPPSQLLSMSSEELQALYEFVPTERQQLYRDVYDDRLTDQGAKGSDEHEYAVASALMEQYDQTRLVPVGMRWAIPSTYVREAVESGSAFEIPEAAFEKKAAAGDKPKPIMLVFLAIGAVLILCMFMPMLSGGGSGGKPSGTPGTKTPTPSRTPVNSPTPTPLALEDQDNIISAGDSSSSSSGGSNSYPVNLSLQLPDQYQPRVFVVQRRQVRVAEWTYADNPDTASMLAGLVIRPVLGIPWSEDNQTLFMNMSAGTRITLRMNTGAVLKFDYVNRLQVQRSDTSIFQQTGPGLILVLIGQHDEASGQPTALRWAITAAYSSRQELNNENVISAGMLEPVAVATSTPTLTPTPVRRITVQMIGSDTQDNVLRIRIRVINDRPDPLTFKPDMVWVVYGYSPQPSEPKVPSEGLKPFIVLPGQAVDLTVLFKYSGEPFGVFGIGDADSLYRFALALRQQ